MRTLTRSRNSYCKRHDGVAAMTTAIMMASLVDRRHGLGSEALGIALRPICLRSLVANFTARGADRWWQSRFLAPVRSTDQQPLRMLLTALTRCSQDHQSSANNRWCGETFLHQLIGTQSPGNRTVIVPNISFFGSSITDPLSHVSI